MVSRNGFNALPYKVHYEYLMRLMLIGTVEKSDYLYKNVNFFFKFEYL